MHDWWSPAVYKVHAALLDCSAGTDLHSLSWEGGFFFFFFVVPSFSLNNWDPSWKKALKQKSVWRDEEEEEERKQGVRAGS